MKRIKRNATYVRTLFLLVIFSSMVLFSLEVRGSAPESLPDLVMSTEDIADSDIFLSKTLPTQGDEILVKARIHNKGERSALGVEVCFYQQNREGDTTLIGEKHLIDEITTNSYITLTQLWIAPQNDFYKITVVMDPDHKLKEKDESNNKACFNVPVVARELFFHYWSCPESTRYVTIRKVEYNEMAYWKERGVLPVRWMWGVQWPDATEEKYVKLWSTFAQKQGYSGIAIDEFGALDGPKNHWMNSAIVKAKKNSPDLFISAWITGLSEGAARAFETGADLVLVECYIASYLNYQKFDKTWAMAKKMGIADKTLFTLGFKNWVTTEQEVVRQIRHIKKTAPEMPGLSFYQSGPEHLHKAADQAVYDYFIKPVIWVNDLSSDKATIKNVGGIDAEDITMNFLSRKPKKGGKMIGSGRIDSLTSGAERMITIPAGTGYVLVLPNENYTVLD